MLSAVREGIRMDLLPIRLCRAFRGRRRRRVSSSRRTPPVVCLRHRPFGSSSCWSRWGPEFGDQPRDFLEQATWHRDLSHLERDVPAMRDDPGANLDPDSYFVPEEFWATYIKPACDKAETKYEPEGRFSDLFRKCVLR